MVLVLHLNVILLAEAEVECGRTEDQKHCLPKMLQRHEHLSLRGRQCRFRSASVVVNEEQQVRRPRNHTHAAADEHEP